MTVSYSDHFFKLLFRWKASIWKSILPNLALYLIVYYIIYLPLFFKLNYGQKASFQKVRAYCETNLGYFPITFLLGFFVAHAVSRWWEQFMLIGWPDRFMFMLIGFVPHTDPETMKIRRNIARWTNLQAVLYYQGFSQRVFKRFPTMDSIVEVGLMTAHEKETYDIAPGPFGKCTLVHVWIQRALNDLKEQGKLNDVQQIKLYEELANYRGGIATLTLYDWAPVPLVYTQVVTLATWGYFLIAMIANMRMHSSEKERGQPDKDVYFPIFLVLQFLFYMGWLKVAQDLFQPFGEDDDDFEMNYMIDRNVSVAEQIATVMCENWPGYSDESFVDISKVVPLPYSKEALKNPGHLFDGNLEHIVVKEKNRALVCLADTEEQLNNHYRNDRLSVQSVLRNSVLRRNRAEPVYQHAKDDSELMMEMENNNKEQEE